MMNRVAKQFRRCLWVFSLLVSFAHPAFAARGIEGNIDDVARAILTYFPKVSGKVTAVHGTAVEVRVESGQGLSEGVLLSVFREGETFHHPVTEVPLGRFENQVGIIEITRFEPPNLTAKNIDPIKKIEEGDLVRLPSTRIPLAIATRSEKAHVFLQSELAAALADTGRFQIDILSLGGDFKTALDQKNRYYIALVTDQIDGNFSMNLNLQNTATGKQLANLDILIRQSEKSDLILEHLQFQLFEQRQKNNPDD